MVDNLDEALAVLRRHGIGPCSDPPGLWDPFEVADALARLEECCRRQEELLKRAVVLLDRLTWHQDGRFSRTYCNCCRSIPSAYADCREPVAGRFHSEGCELAAFLAEAEVVELETGQ